MSLSEFLDLIPCDLGDTPDVSTTRWGQKTSYTWSEIITSINGQKSMGLPGGDFTPRGVITPIYSNISLERGAERVRVNLASNC